MIKSIALAAALVAGCAGCSSSGDGTPATSPLIDALAKVPDTANTRTSVLFSRPADALAANGGAPIGPYTSATNLTGAAFAQTAQVHDAFGIDFAKSDTSVAAGVAPTTGTWLTGLDLAGLGAAVRKLGATASRDGSSTIYRFRPDHRIALNDRLGTALPSSLGTFNVMSVDGDELRFGDSTAALRTVSATSGPTLADDQDVVGVAECLGSPLAAQLVDAGHAGAELPTAVTEVGAAVSGGKGARPTETLCVATRTSDQATNLATAVRRAAEQGSSARTNARWSTLITDSKVSVTNSGAHVVKLSAHPTRSAGGLLLQALQSSDIASLLGR